MKTPTLLILTFLMHANAQAQMLEHASPINSNFSCSNKEGQSFTLTTGTNPDNEADAKITAKSDNLDLGGGTSAWLTESKSGFYSSQFTYELVGGQLIISMSQRPSRSSIGNWVVSAKFTDSEKKQEIIFDCN